MAARESDLETYTGWRRGKDTVSAETALPVDALREALNVDLNNAGKPRLRKGRTVRYAGSNIHSLWGAGALTLFVEDGVLKRLYPDWSVATVKSGLDPQHLVSYDEVNGEVYYSNGVQTGIVSSAGVQRPWGVKEPSGQALLAAHVAGGLRAGRYQVAVTFVAASGELSGASLASVIEVSEGQGIQLSGIPQPNEAQVMYARIYVSDANGEILYRQADVPVGVTSYSINTTIKTEPLDTQFMQVAPPGHIVRHYKGRMLIAEDNVLWYTEALRYGLYRPAENYFPFAERITVVQPVDDGVYVVADKTYFLAGSDMAQMGPIVASPHRAVEGTGLRADAEMFRIDKIAGEVAYWFSTKGAVLGFAGGVVKPIMEKQLAVSQYDTGVTLFRTQDGIRQLVTAVRGKGEASSFAAGDSVTAEVRRNGILI